MHIQRVIALATAVRRVWEPLAAVTTELADAHRQELAAEAFDIELQLINLHGRVLELAGKPIECPAPEQLPGLSNDVPF